MVINGWDSLISCACARLDWKMSLYKYFKKPPSQTDVLPSPEGPLKEIIPSSTIASINKDVGKELMKEASKERGPYSKLTPSQKALIGKRAAIYGVTASMRYFRAKYPDLDLKETSVRRFKNSYNGEMRKQKRRREPETVDIEIEELPAKRRGRPTLLFEDMEVQLKAYLDRLREKGGVVNTAITIASARGIVIKRDSNLLDVNGGHICLSKHWAKSFLQRIGFVKCKGTTKAQVTVADFELLKQDFIFTVKSVIQMDEIPSQLVINWDQTGIHYVPVSEWTMEKCGARRVAIAGITDKRQITAVFGGTLSGDFLPPQLVYQGKTKKCLPSVVFPCDWDVICSPNHWSNEQTMKSYLQKIMIPYIETKRKELGLPNNYPSLVIFDNFKAQCTDDLLALLTENNIHYMFIPANCTDRLQPLDLSVNKAAKNYLRNCFQEWYAEQMGLQLDSEEDATVDLRMSVVKPLGAQWMISLYDYFKSHSEIIINGYKAAGIITDSH